MTRGPHIVGACGASGVVRVNLFHNGSHFRGRALRLRGLKRTETGRRAVLGAAIRLPASLAPAPSTCRMSVTRWLGGRWEATIRCMPLGLPWAASKHGPCWPESSEHPAPASTPRQATPTLTTPSSAGALSPTTSITGQLQTEGKGCLAWAWGTEARTGWRARDHSPERLGIGHRPRSVNV